MAKETAYFIAEKSLGAHDSKEIKRELGRLPGVSSVSVNPQNHLVAVDYDSAGVSYDKIENSLNRMGYQILADASLINTR